MDRAQIEDLYPVPLLQEGILFHALMQPGVYTEQFPRRLRGRLDVPALERSFHRLVARHPALRTGFVWEGVPRTLQAVFRTAEPECAREDWSRLGDAEWPARFEAYLEADYRRAFDLRRAPLARMLTAKIGEDHHILLVTCHHAVTDGWSLPILFGDLWRLYREETGAGPANLSPAPRFRDYVAWVVGQDASALEAFWRAELAPVTAPTPLPFQARLGPGTDDNEVERRWLGPDEWTRLDAFARRNAVTPATVVQGAWGLLMARYAGEDEALCGVTVSGRPPEVPGVEGMVGMFVNSLPVRVPASPTLTVREWLGGLQARMADLRQHGHVRLTDLHGWTSIPRERMLFETAVVYEAFPWDVAGDPGDETGNGLEALPITRPERTSFPLMLIVIPWHGLDLRLVYPTRRYTAAQVAVLADALVALLRGILEAERLGDLATAGAAERAKVAAWRDGGEPARRAEPVHRAVERQAARTPHAVAVRGAAGSLTYAGLDAAAGRLARRLRALGVGPDARVAVSLERTPAMAAAVLGVLKAGGCYVALDPAYPADRRAAMLADAGVAAVVTQSSLVADLPPTDAPRVVVDEAGRFEGDEALEPFSADVSSDGLAYLLYTSGSTGRPKGVAMPHRGLSRLLDWQLARWGDGAAARTLQFASLSFDVSFQEMFGAWAAGGTLVLVDEWTRRDPHALLAHLREERVERLFLPFAALDALAEAAEGLDARLPHLRQVITAGEALRVTARVRAFFAANPGATLENQYGPSETHVVSAQAVEGSADGWEALPPIGRPIRGTRLYVLDSAHRSSPVGAPGGLYAAGESLARGYLGRPALTAERFLPDPFSTSPGARMYRTGDRAQWRDDGALEFLGRADEQVKVRGYRVEPGEVEVALAAHPGVGGAAVVAREDGRGGARLAAYVVAHHGAGLDDEALREHLRLRLPEYMVPASVTVLDAFPLTPSGKVDRRALPEPVDVAETAFVAPRTSTEEALAAVWAELLGAERVGAGDHFFRLGGHSLLVTRLVGRIRSALEVEVPVRTLYETPVLSAQATVIDALREAELERLVAELEEMSEEEARAAIAAEQV